MTQDLGNRPAPPKLPRELPPLLCTRCGIAWPIVDYSIRVGKNICQPKCPETN
jgi:hypothetical protein